MSFIIRQATMADFFDITAIYNSNPGFLHNHLGVDHIDTDFIRQEHTDMALAGFSTCVLMEDTSELLAGVLEYRAGQEVYLSLLMLGDGFQGMGGGASAYGIFEEEMRNAGHDVIRIDVVDDYRENVVGFWKKQGFEPAGRVQLTWGLQTSEAVIMKKTL